MTPDELRQLIYEDSRNFKLAPNTANYMLKFRAAALSDYKQDDFPMLAGLENSWKAITEQTPFLLEGREALSIGSPLSAFMCNVAAGYYPPPEVMLAMLTCFEHYYARNGQKTLDEIFFGKPHGKKTNAAFAEKKNMRYSSFERFYQSRVKNSGSNSETLVDIAEAFLKSDFHDGTKIDPETFLRGYRRWAKPVDK